MSDSTRGNHHSYTPHLTVYIVVIGNSKSIDMTTAHDSTKVHPDSDNSMQPLKVRHQHSIQVK